MANRDNIVKFCPECGTKIRYVSKPKYSCLALMLFFLAPFAALLLYASVGLSLPEEDSNALGYPQKVLFKFLSLACFGVGLLALKIPKFRRARCHQCGWKKKYWLRRRPKIDPADLEEDDRFPGAKTRDSQEPERSDHP